MFTVGNRRLQQVTAGYSRLGYRVVTVGYSRWVTAGYSSRWVQQVTVGYRVVTVSYNRLQQVTEWLQWVTAGYRLSSGYSGLQQVTAG